MRVWTRRIGGLALVLVVGAGLHVALRERPIPVDTAIVDRGSMQVTIDAEGVARVREVYTVSSPIAGHLARTTLDEGEPAKAHETVIASIRPLAPPFLDQRTGAELEAAARAARAAVSLAEVKQQRAQTALDLARSSYRRAEKLVRTKTMSIGQFEHAYGEFQLRSAEVAGARAMIDLRKAELASAEARQRQPGHPSLSGAPEGCCVDITAPVDGVVLKVLARSEQAVSPGTRIAEVGDPGDLEIVADLLSRDAARIEPGATVLMTDWGGESDLRGTVRTVEPAAFTKVSSLGIEEQRVNVVIDPATVPVNLGQGYRVVARLAVWRQDDVLKVPIAALFRSGGEWSVFAVDGERAGLRRIAVGRMDGSHAQVLDGLQADDVVILYPSDVVEDGSLVEERANAR